MKLDVILIGALASTATAASTLAPRAISTADRTFQKTILDTHNKARAYHGSTPLTWSDAAASVAQNWANQIQSNCQMRHSGTPGYGENLYGECCTTPDSLTATKNGVVSWYNEVSLYNYSNPGFSAATGHFTQVVWNSTKQIGCAWTQAACGAGWWYLVCEYNPPGNFLGQFPQNVKAPVCSALKF